MLTPFRPGLVNFSVKSQGANLFHFAAQIISVAPTHLCHGSMKTTKDSAWTNGCGFIPIKLYLQKDMTGWICELQDGFCSLQTLDLNSVHLKTTV